MPKANVLGVSLGESFVELSLVSGDQVVAHKLSYLPKESFKSSLQNFLATQAEFPLNDAYVNLRLSPKLFSQELSGPIALLVTEGFESWTAHDKDWVFSVHERVATDGQILKPLSIDDLAPIAAKLQLMNCQRISLHFLNATANSSHQTQAAAYFREMGFEVFTPTSPLGSEAAAWKAADLNALAKPVFDDLIKTLREGLGDKLTDDRIHFMSSESCLTAAETAQPLAQLHAHLSALTCDLPKETELLYLGLEGFYLVRPQLQQKCWNSPWGKANLDHIAFEKLSLQPTTQVDLNAFGHIDFSTRQESWEPGPMMLGRGQRPTLIDLWASETLISEMPVFSERIVASGQQRFKNSLMALAKNDRGGHVDIEDLSNSLREKALQCLIFEVQIKRRQPRLHIAGPLRGLVKPLLSQNSITENSSEAAEATSLAKWGQRLQQESK